MKRVNPLRSGIHTIPLVLSLVVASIVAGGVTAKIGYYVPALLFSGAVTAVGDGLLSTFTASAPSSRWIAYQFLTGFGVGSGLQSSGLAVQTVLPREHVAVGMSISFFAQQLGGAVSVAVGQAVLSNVLVSRLRGVPGLDPAAIVRSGATDLAAVVPARDMPLVVEAYNDACTKIFLAALGFALAALVSALGVEWKSVKKGRQGPPAAAAAAKGSTSGPEPPAGEGKQVGSETARTQ